MNDRLQLLKDSIDVPDKPWERLSVLLFANGKPIHDIAQEVNQPVNKISAYITSPKGSAQIKALVGDNEERIVDLIEAAAVDSVLALVRIRDTAASPQAQVSAACQLLDRASPKIKSQDKGNRDRRKANDFNQVADEAAALRQQLGL